MKKVLLIDLGHLAHRYLFATSNDIKVAGYGVLRHTLLTFGIFPYITQFKPDEVYIGVDYKKSWRKELTSIYKANRAELRDKTSDNIDWNGFYIFMDEFVNELHDVFPFYVPLVPHLEADDVIGWLVKTLPVDNEKIIVTGDTDYIQLLKYPNVKLWSPNKKGLVTGLDAERELLIKIIIGDKSDNIPGCRKGVGLKKAIKLIESGELEKILNEVDGDGKPCEFRRNFDRNKKLIDMDMIPTGLTNRLRDYLINYQLADGSKFFRYLLDKQLREMFDNIEKYRKILKPFIPVKEEDGINQKVPFRLGS
jgi:5'-3' exonuclease